MVFHQPKMAIISHLARLRRALQKERKIALKHRLGATFRFFCGESEIRTRDTLLGYTRFPGVPLQPLEHLSFCGCKDMKKYLFQQTNFVIIWKMSTFADLT